MILNPEIINCFYKIKSDIQSVPYFYGSSQYNFRHYNISSHWLTTRLKVWKKKTHTTYNIKFQLKVRLLLLIENRLRQVHNDDYLWLIPDM